MGRYWEKRPRDGCSKAQARPLRQPDKDSRRCRACPDRRRPVSIPFTTGLLVGIGETLSSAPMRYIRFISRARSSNLTKRIDHCRTSAPRTRDDALPRSDFLATVAVARLVLGRRASRAPPVWVWRRMPELFGAGSTAGGVPPCGAVHVSPERPWRFGLAAVPRQPRHGAAAAPNAA